MRGGAGVGGGGGVGKRGAGSVVIGRTWLRRGGGKKYRGKEERGRR